MLYAHDLKIEQTCEKFPEEYCVFDSDDKEVGYIRLRSGFVSAFCPDCKSDICIYEALTNSCGYFNSNRERKKHLRRAKEAIARWWNQNVDNS